MREDVRCENSRCFWGFNRGGGGFALPAARTADATSNRGCKTSRISINCVVMGIPWRCEAYHASANTKMSLSKAWKLLFIFYFPPRPLLFFGRGG